MALEKLNQGNYELELNSVYKSTREKLNKLNEKVKDNNPEIIELKDNNPETVKLKNYEVKNYWSYFSIDINDLYWLTIKKVDWEIVFDAKHEWFYSKEDIELSEEEIIDNWNIDMINRYLKSKDQKLITDKKDIKLLNSLFKKL